MRLKIVIFSLFMALSPFASNASSWHCERLFAVSAPKFVTETPLSRLTDLKQIRAYIQSTGGDVTIVVDRGDIPKRMNQALVEFIYGAKVIVVGDERAPESPRKISGTVLHFGDADYLKNYVVGDLDLLVDWRDQYDRFDDKVYEVEWATGIDPGIMPRTLTFDNISKELLATERGRMLFRSVQDIKRHLTGDPKFKWTDMERIVLADYLEAVIAIVNSHFPTGAVIKHAREFQTGDTGGIIKSKKLDVPELVEQFISNFYKIRKRTLRQEERKRLSQKDLDDDRFAATFNKRWTLVQSLVFGQFGELMAQEMLNIKKEIRLDVARGNVINAVDRFDKSWVPKELFEAATKFVNEFFAKLPYPDNIMAGGVDVALLENGKFVIIDFNIGATSGFLDGPKAPVSTNMYVASLLGRRTPFLDELHSIGKLDGVESKKKAISTFANKYLKYLNEEDKEGIMFDIVRWLRHEDLINDAEELSLLPQ